jgi:long-subunit acyl-CoA synthetase (AMP-forming)
MAQTVFAARLSRDNAPPLKGADLGPDDAMLPMYTSGTTGEPKGVMHTSNSLFSNLHAYAERMERKDSEVILSASPMAHLTGYGPAHLHMPGPSFHAEGASRAYPNLLQLPRKIGSRFVRIGARLTSAP